MKKSISFSIYSLVFCLPLLFSCSEEILEGDRYKEMAFVEPKRHILIEDFTGQKCRNCPEAHQVIDELQALYGDYVIAVAIHADLGSNGVFGIAEGKDTNTIGLMQPEGDEYAMRWGVSFLPAGLINRNSKPLKHTEWAAYARQALAREAQATIALSSEVVDNTLRVNTEILSATNLEGKLQLWITESNITALQQNGRLVDYDYLHSHVYRAAINGFEGEAVVLKANEAMVCEHVIALRNNWKVENLSVIAFVYTEADGVVAVSEYHL